MDDGGRPQVIIFTGLPGTGKSTLAERVARAVRAPAFAGDWLMGGLNPRTRPLVSLIGRSIWLPGSVS
jgi:predicted kinase